MIFIKCLDVKKSRMFFVISELSEEDHLKLIDILLDMKIKMKATNLEEMENQNPFLQDFYNIYCFKEELKSIESVKIYLESEESSDLNKITRDIT